MKRFYFLIFLFLNAPHANAAEVLQVDKKLKIQNLNEALSYYVDNSASREIDQIISREINSGFKDSHDGIIDLGLTNAAVWGKFTYKGLPEVSPSKSGNHYLLFTHNYDNLDFYYPDQTGAYKITRSGSSIPYNQREVKFNQFLFELPVSQAETTVYFRARSLNDKIFLNPVILSTEGLIDFSDKDKIINAVYLGIILSMIIYNLFTLIMFRDKTYFFYILYLLSAGFAFLLGFNFLSAIFFPDRGGLYFPVSYLSILLGLVFSLQFLRNFLYTSINLPEIDRILNWLSLGLLPFYTIYFIDKKIFLYIFYCLTLLVPSLMIYTGLKLYRKYAYARIFTNAWAIYVASIIFYGLGFFSTALFSNGYLLEIGHAIEASLLSIAMSYKMKELHHRASRDFLTGIFNRSSFQENLSRQIAFLQINPKKHRDLSLIVFDIDNFKKINDILGHEIGDNVLKTIARLIPEHLRAHDCFCRWGGEEFVIIAPDTSLENASVMAEKIRKLIETNHFPVVENITASFGVAACIPGESQRDFFHRADKAMYRAKSNGKNRVEISAGEIPPEENSLPELILD